MSTTEITAPDQQVVNQVSIVMSAFTEQHINNYLSDVRVDWMRLDSIITTWF